MTLYQQYRSRGLEVVLIDFREPPDLVRRVVKERGYTTPVLLDQRGDVSGIAWGVFGPPTTYFVDRQGRLLARGVGPRDWSSPATRKLLEDLLAAR
jgi:cytochrome c biogenesis protein CcmG/thiol:disulfide interchange protein DsbE